MYSTVTFFWLFFYVNNILPIQKLQTQNSEYICEAIITDELYNNIVIVYK